MSSLQLAIVLSVMVCATVIALGGSIAFDRRYGSERSRKKMPGDSDPTDDRADTDAMANLAEGIQGLVQHMRSEQQMIRRWVEAQSEQQNEVKRLLERLAVEHENR